MKTIRNTLLIGLIVLAVITAWADNDETATDQTKLQGTWTMVSGERDGQAFSDDIRKTFKRVAKDNETTVTAGAELMLKAKFSVDPSKQPKTIDYSVIGGSYAGSQQLGIYELEGETVKFCFAVPGKPRPTSFSTKSDDGRTLTVWKKVKP
jgi:uncharacterized protein (TIGR03067 family)